MVRPDILNELLKVLHDHFKLSQSEKLTQGVECILRQSLVKVSERCWIEDVVPEELDHLPLVLL